MLSSLNERRTTHLHRPIAQELPVPPAFRACPHTASKPASRRRRIAHITFAPRRAEAFAKAEIPAIRAIRATQPVQNQQF